MKIRITKQITQKTLIFALTLLVVGLANATNIIAQNNLDPTFGNGGKVITDINGVDFANGLVIQPDGKFIAAGAANSNFAVVRYNGNGSLDASFGSGGKVITDFGGSDAALAVALQPDGKIVAAGSSSNNFALARYNADGSLDSTFGSGGKITTDFFGFSDSAQAVIIQPDGKIVAAGIARPAVSIGDFGLVRYNSNGSLDTTFGNGGKVSTDFNGQYDGANALVLQADGKLVAAGYAGVVNNPSGWNVYDNALVRYNPDGSLDSTFGSGGKVVTDFVGPEGEQDNGISVLVVQADGKLVAAGYTSLYDISYTILTRYNTNGTLLDTTFFGSSRFGYFTGLALQADGKIVASGSFFINGNYDFGLARYNAKGTLDTTFGTGGTIATNFGNSDVAVGVVIQPDGKIVAAGYTANANYSVSDFALARYLGDSVVAQRTQFDFDGDGKADISVFRPSDGVWYLNRSTQGFSATQFGLSSDRITPGDYDGDGKTDIAVYRPETGVWWLLYSSDNSVVAFQFGLNGDLPVVGDYDGDGRADIAVFRPSNGVWYLQRSSAGFTAFQFGLSTDKPTQADYDGDGRTDIAVYRPSDGNWYLQRSAAGFGVINFGIGEDIPSPGDYDGDGKSDVAVFRPSTGVWWLWQSTNGLTAAQFGLNGDAPVPAGYLP